MMGPVPAALRRYAPLALALAGALLLVIAEFSPLYEIKVITVVKETKTAGAHHGYALLVIGLAAAFMAWGAVIGGSRPAAWALLALSVIALAITLAIDLPNVDETGLIGRNYEQAATSPQTGFYLETLGSVLLLLSAVAVLVFRPQTDEATTRRATAAGSPSAS